MSGVASVAEQTAEKTMIDDKMPSSAPPAPPLPSSAPMPKKDTAVWLHGLQTTPYEQLILRSKAAIDSFIESIPVVLTMSLFTIWALFSDDVRLASTKKDADMAFTGVISVAFFLFLLEIVLASYAKGQDYFFIPEQVNLPGETAWMSFQRRAAFGSFYFWLDCIATLSLIFEIDWIIGDALTTGQQAAKGGNASRAGARAGRIVRLVRMVRLIRMVKLYKYASKMSNKDDKKNIIVDEDGESEELPQQSRVGSALTDLTNRRVIILVLVMLIIIPNLQATEDDLLFSIVTQTIDRMARGFYTISQSDYNYAKNATVANAISYTRGLDNGEVIKVTFNGAQHYYNEKIYTSLRASEIVALAVEDSGFTTVVSFDNSHHTSQDSLYAVFTTIFVIFVLVTGTIFFSSDVTRLVITPIERMVELVQKISADPLGVEYKMMGEDEGFVKGMETTILLTTITKICALMRVGFGEAGADVIARSLNDGGGGKINLMGGGNMITSIFGFCDVRQFTDTTECLQEEVMLFVNRIAHILHNIIVQCAGSANKNIGDAFLLTWKVDQKLNADQISLLADQALYAFCKTLIELGRYSTFICNFTVQATARLYKRFPNYAVRIGSGLHVGWAIEGAIGSHRKIDASYLSPNVNFTEFLESSTKAYGVPLLMSEPFYKLLSPAAQKYVRQVDRIKKSAKEEPMGLYTYDSDVAIDWADPYRKKFNMAKAGILAAQAKSLSKLGGDKDGKGRRGSRDNDSSAMTLAALQFEHEHAHDAEAALLLKAKQAPTITVTPYTFDIWDDDEDLVDLRHQVSEKFRSIWAGGIEAYIKGDWRKARDIFHETMQLSGGKDGPSQFLIDEIDHHGGSAPSDWRGYRVEGAGGH